MEQLNILYIGTQSRYGFVTALATRDYIQHYFAIGATQAYEHLQNADGVVLIGLQDRVFSSDHGYLAFLDEVHRQQKLVAAILHPLDGPLPKQNKGIDKVIISGPHERTIGSLAKELYELFSSDSN